MTSARRKAHRIPLLAALLIASAALAACGEDELDPGAAADAPDYSAAVAAAPPKLAALYESGGAIVDGGLPGYEDQIAELEGFPVVVNKWASWCLPCRQEFPHLQNQAADHADEVAFLGINSADSTAAAETFLSGHPIPYPSFADPDETIARDLDLIGFPQTAFYDRDGEIVHIRRGVYASEEELAADIERYALRD